MDNGWIKIYRKFAKWEWYDKSEMVHLFLHFLLLANHDEQKWRGKIIKKGQFITGRKKLSGDTGISEQTIRTCINRLKSTNEITIRSTSQFSFISIVNWGEYQDKNNNNQPAIQPTTNQQLTTNKNDKNDKEVKNIERVVTPSQNMKNFLNDPSVVVNMLKEKGISEELAAAEIRKFIAYWTELNKSGTKQRWELEKTFEANRRLTTWFSNIKNFNQSKEKKGVRI